MVKVKSRLSIITEQIYLSYELTTIPSIYTSYGLEIFKLLKIIKLSKILKAAGRFTKCSSQETLTTRCDGDTLCEVCFNLIMNW